MNIKWWKQHSKIQNFGDYIAAYLHDKIIDVSKSSFDSSVVHRSVGSVICNPVIKDDVGLGAKNILFFGCGARGNPVSKDLLSYCNFGSVRGPLTRQLLNLEDTTKLGDSALILPAIYLPITSSDNHVTTLVTHFNESRADKELLELTGCSRVISSKCDNDFSSLESLISDIVSSSFVFTSSLHGAIIARAYNVPFAYWDSGDINVPFKWKDFSLSINMNCVFHKQVSEGINWYKEQEDKIHEYNPNHMLADYKNFFRSL